MGAINFSVWNNLDLIVIKLMLNIMLIRGGLTREMGLVLFLNIETCIENNKENEKVNGGEKLEFEFILICSNCSFVVF